MESDALLRVKYTDLLAAKLLVAVFATGEELEQTY